MKIGITLNTNSNQNELAPLLFELTKLHVESYVTYDTNDSELKNCEKVITSDQINKVVQTQAQETSDPKNNWYPWFPVIDFDRCTNCMQCLSFCLFDVYGVDEHGKIKIKNPTNCKTNCPACSRVCPDVAIVFPKYRNSPINGDVVSQEDLSREKMKIDISTLLGGDLYQTLRARTEKARSRFSKERNEDRALKERQKCLKEIQEAMDIPDEVLNSLPSMDQIQNKFQKLLDTSKPSNDSAGGN